MSGVSRTIAVLALIVALVIPHTLAHSYLTSPTSRSNQKQSNNGCRGPACLGPCDVAKDRATTAAVKVQRGQTINVQWPRNNHPGGFIRLAWAPWSQSDSHSAFDGGVQKIVCHEAGGCKPDDANNPNGGDSGPADGSRNACSTTITVPEHLADGKYTLQWIWYGGGFALGDYHSCVDYEVAGGPSGARKNAVFQGGDYTYPNQQKCKYFNTDAPHICVNEPCNNPPRPGEAGGAPAGFGGAASSSSGSASSSSPGSSSGSSSSSSGSASGTGSTPPTPPASTSGSGNNGQCVAGMASCKKAPQTNAQYQCCSPGAQCLNSGDFGVCCGPSTVGCIYGSADSKQSACCDTRYLKCDSSKGCVEK